MKSRQAGGGGGPEAGSGKPPGWLFGASPGGSWTDASGGCKLLQCGLVDCELAWRALPCTPRMQARAIMDVPRHSSGSEMDEGSAGGSLGTRFDAVASTTGAAGGSGLGSCSLPGSLGSIPEDALAHTAQGAGCMAQARSDSMPSGSLPGGASSPLAGGSPRSVAELPHGQARPCAHAGQQQQQQQHLTEQQQQRQQVTAALAGGGESPVSGAGSGDGG